MFFTKPAPATPPVTPPPEPPAPLPYNYEERMRVYSRVCRLPSSNSTEIAIKIIALDQFIKEEEAILQGLLPPEFRSQALDAARQMMRSLQQ